MATSDKQAKAPVQDTSTSKKGSPTKTNTGDIANKNTDIKTQGNINATVTGKQANEDEKVNDSHECTVALLDNIITESSNGMYRMPSRDMDEICPGLFVGDVDAARHVKTLKSRGITHVLNVAEGGNDSFHVKSNKKMYETEGMQYLGMEASDSPDFMISKYFDESSFYIDEAIQKGGRVLLHCREGYSRAPTIATAYFMIKRHMTAQDALRLVRSKREVGPNEGFLKELCELNERLQAKEHFLNRDRKV